MKSDLNPRPHSVILNDSGRLVCVTCKNTWKNGPQSLCVGIPVYPGLWEKVWPEGLMTKTQLNKAGYTTGKKLPPPAALLHWSKSPQEDGYLRLYNPADAIPKRRMSDAQRAALEKAQAANYEYWHCDRCGRRVQRYRNELCHRCEMVDWAVSVLARDDLVILDTETTGLDVSDDPVQIAVIDRNGATLFNSLIKPRDPARLLEGAARVNGIYPQDVENAPSFPAIYPALAAALRGCFVVVYNADYDLPLLAETCEYHSLPHLPYAGADCAMLAASQWFGWWSYYWQGYQWQPLPGGDHTALGDCLATLEVLRAMKADDFGIWR